MEHFELLDITRNQSLSKNLSASSLSLGVPSSPNSPFIRPLSSPPRLSVCSVTGAKVEDFDPFVPQVQLSDQVWEQLRCQTSSPAVGSHQNAGVFSLSADTDHSPINSTPTVCAAIVASEPKLKNKVTSLSDSKAPKTKKRLTGGDASPEKLPRPANSWILYRSDKIIEMKALNHGLAQSVLSKEIAARWHNETPEVRKDYEKKAEIIKAEHAVKYPDYKYNPKRKKPNEQRKLTSKQSFQCNSGSASTHHSSSPEMSSNEPDFGSSSAGVEPTELGNFSSNLSNGLILPTSLEADLYDTYPLLGQLAAVQDLESQRQILNVGVSASPFVLPSYPASSVPTPQGSMAASRSTELAHTSSSSIPGSIYPTHSALEFSPTLDPLLHFDSENRMVDWTITAAPGGFAQPAHHPTVGYASYHSLRNQSNQPTLERIANSSANMQNTSHSQDSQFYNSDIQVPLVNHQSLSYTPSMFFTDVFSGTSTGDSKEASGDHQSQSKLSFFPSSQLTQAHQPHQSGFY